MAKTNATTQTPTATKETKMAQARAIYDEITAKGYDLQGLSPRRAFINRAATELNMKAAGANTYFQNLKNEDEGKGRYYTPASATPAPTTKGDVKTAEGDVLAQLQVLTTGMNRMSRQLARLEKSQRAAS